MKSRIFFSLLFLSTACVFASKYAGEFLALGFGARSLSMGQLEGVLTGEHSFYGNPAAMCFSSKTYSATHAYVFSGNLSYNGLSLVFPETKRAVGFGLVHLGISGIPYTLDALRDYGEDGIPGTNDPGENNGILDPGEWLDYDRVSYFSDDDYTLYLSYGHRAGDNFSMGASVKAVYRKIGSYSAYGVGTDLGCFFRTKNIDFSAVLRNATTTIISWSTGTKEFAYPFLKTGVMAKAPLSWRDVNISFGIETDIYFENRKLASQWDLSSLSADIHYGGEISVKEKFFLRAGANSGHLTAGGGIAFSSFSVDYGFMSHQQLGSSHRFSLSYFPR
ncbi:hypothetical protein JW890_05205 [candidate division WOR-3 bacterium]|nr:hypothetical protein [candidate division WOR-3 bacterium]